MKNSECRAAQGLGCGIRHERAEQTLGHSHMEPPESDSRHRSPEAGGSGQRDISEDEHSEAGANEQPSIGGVRQRTHRVRRGRVEQVHPHQREWSKLERQAQGGEAQYQESFAEAR
jgi:hypothetical protein